MSDLSPSHIKEQINLLEKQMDDAIDRVAIEMQTCCVHGDIIYKFVAALNACAATFGLTVQAIKHRRPRTAKPATDQ